ncbi:MAG TPA: FAD-linked oxidase C-terminal domain-containing protein [Elusimicrobiota bacterium]|nr:FAD-linked oxidase C-terminal domain-containing protein [Elusimicrobiota bacterium]
MNPKTISLFKKILGPDRVKSGLMDLFVYTYDAAVDKRWPGLIVWPQTVEEVSAVVKEAWRNNIPYVVRGAGTNLCGSTIPSADGLVIHLTRMNKILRIDPQKRVAWVEPGVINFHLQKALMPYGLFYAPDPASQKACTIGGNIGTNAGGPHCLKYGVTSHHVTALEWVLPNGDVVRTTVDESGYDLTGFFVGSEGTLGIMTKAELTLLPIPETIRTMLVSFPSVESSIEAVTDIISHGIIPTTLEAMDRTTIEAVESFVHAGYPSNAEAVLLIEVDGGAATVDGDMSRIEDLCRAHGSLEIRLARDEKEREKLWEGRRGSYASLARLAPNVLVEDGTVPRDRLPEAMRRVKAISDREHLKNAFLFHAGDGNLHPQIVFDERDEKQTEKVRRAGNEMLKVCVDLGGSISGEHGIGLDKREAMNWLFSPDTIRVFQTIKSALDPVGLANPGKVIPEVPPAPASPPAADRDWPDLFEPGSVEELRAFVGSRRTRRESFYIGGTQSKGFYIPDGEPVLSTVRLNAVVEHNRPNFTLTVQAGARLEDVKKTLAAANQFLHVAGNGSLGGIVAARLLADRHLRDQILGLKAVMPDGSLAEFGGRVMKNVAGYDVAKLFIGSWGTLGIIVELTLRTFPVAFTETAFPGRAEVFSPNRLHRRIKKALDPDNLLNPNVFSEGANR